MQGWNLVYANATQAFWDQLYRFGLSLSHNAHDAEDLVQISLLKGLKSFKGFVDSRFPGIQSAEEAQRLFEKPANLTYLKNWLFKILKNTFLDNIEKNKRLVCLDTIDDWESAPAQSYEEAEFSGLHQVSKAELAKFENAFYNLALDDNWQVKLQVLTAKQRSVLYLCAEGYTYQEVAEVLDIPIGTVMSNLSRSLNKLRRQKIASSGE